MLCFLARTRHPRPACAGWILALLLVARWTSADDLVPADPESRWFKGNIHTHTLWSDGDDFPEMVAEWYRTRDYNFLALSDHNILSEGIRWIPRVADDEALRKYRDRFGDRWVETRGEPDAEGKGLEVRLKPLSEFRSLVESRGQFIMIPGEEITASVTGLPVHMNATNIKHLIDPLVGRDVAETIQANLRAVEIQAERNGREILVHLNHPNFYYAITAEEMATVVAERFFEVFNGHPAVAQPGDAYRPSIERMWDIANTIRVAQLTVPPLMGVATDDSHDYHGVDGATPGRGWIMVRAYHLTAESLIRSMRRGEFYASSGVTLAEVAYDQEQGVLRVEIDAEPGVTYKTQFVGTAKDYDRSSQPRLGKDGEPIRATRQYSADVGKVFAEQTGTQATYRLTGEELYVRAIVISDRTHPQASYEGQMEQAWTQPVGWERWVK